MSVLTLDRETAAEECFLSRFWPVVAVAAATANMLVAWFLLEPRKRRGWDLTAVLRSCRASWR